MASGSSGSIQSSSAGDEEYNSRADGISGFLNNPSHGGPEANPPQLVAPAVTQPHHHTHSSSSTFDPFSNFFDPLPTRSHQNSLLNLDAIWPRNPRSDHNPTELSGLIPSSSTQTQPPVPHQVVERSTPRGLTLADRSEGVNNNGDSGVRNPRKRTRASRRAPTTVLTTDTSNFRAMVQEFTGIPAPPFTPASFFPRARLDLLGSSSISSPPYLLRPFPHKLTPPSTSSVYPSASDFLLPKQNLNLQPLHHIPHLQTGFLEDFSLSQSHGGASLSGNAAVRHNTGGILPASWGAGGAVCDQTLIRPVNGKYCTGKVQYSASSSDFHGEKGSEIVTARSEGMIESWICSSDL